jgi:DNA-binding response OmpR family regulator
MLDAVGDKLGVEAVSLNGDMQRYLAQPPHAIDAFVIEYPRMAQALEALRDLRQLYEVEPILVLTNERDDEQLVEAYLSGANDCIPVTISTPLFAAKLGVWLRWAQMFRPADAAPRNAGTIHSLFCPTEQSQTCSS